MNATLTNPNLFDLGVNSLGGTLSGIANTGTIKTACPASLPIPAGKTWGGTVEYSGSSAQTAVGGTFNNLTFSGSGGAAANSPITVNGTLNLTGNLAMADPNTLLMGGAATTLGTGDVTGIVTRNSFSPNVAYSFGNQFTTVTLSNSSQLPASLSFKISIGTAPSWKTDAILRWYDIIRTGTPNGTVTLNLHYKDGELNGNTPETSLVLWDMHVDQGNKVEEHGKSNQSTTDKWVGLSNLNASYFGTVYDHHTWTLAKSAQVACIWLGQSTDWTSTMNWSCGHVPLSTEDVDIPDASTTAFDPLLPASTSIKSMTIESGGILNDGGSSVLTITGSSGAWLNLGTFYPGTSTVIFTNAKATMADPTDFYNVTIAAGAGLTPGTGNVMRIAGALVNSGTLNAALLDNTIEYNGTSQSVINPNGSTPGYSKLVLSGSGVKTMPLTPLSVGGDFSISGTATVNAGEAISVGGNVTLSSGTIFNAGSFTHNIAGNWTNNGGTFNFSSGILNFNGSSLQTITSGSGFTLNNLTISNTSAAVVLGSSTNCSIGGNLAVNSNALFDLGLNQLITIAGSITNSGTLRTENTSVTPVPSGKAWGGTFEYAGNSAQSAVTGTYTNLLLSGTGGATATGDMTVNGVLELSVQNPSATKGILDMDLHTLTMGGVATTTGPGDLTGIVRRTTILPNTTYSLGNEFTSITFPNVGTLPSEMSLKITIGTTPAWRAGAIQRTYDFIQTGGSGTQAVINAHYLDSELNGNVENKLVDWSYRYSGPVLTEHGRSNFNTIDNWVALANANVAFFSSSFGAVELSLDESELTSLTWNGSVSTSWTTAENWTPNGGPSDNTVIIIPDAATTPNDPSLPSIATCGTLTIESGGILNTDPDAQLTVNGSSGAWSNQGGTFNQGTGTVKFSNPNATINGATNFYNLTLLSGSGLTMTTNSLTKISGTFTNNGTLNAALFDNTIEFNGGSQSIINPNGLTQGYHNLTLSGTGMKSLPASSLAVYGDLSLNSDFSANGGTLAFAGSAAQTIVGTTTPDFNNFTVTNSNGVSLNVNSIVSGDLSVTDGWLVLNPGVDLTVTGTTNLNPGQRLTLESDAVSTASFIDHGITGGGTGTVERYLTNSGTGSEWHLVSSPIEGGESGIFLSEYLMQYTEPLHTYQYITPIDSLLHPMRGYAVWVNNTSIKRFTGLLNTGDKNFTVTRTWMADSIPPEYDGWNLIGNPYPSGLDASLLTYSGVEPAAWFWDLSGSGNYKVWVPGGGETHSKYIPSMQGFFVHCNNATLSSPLQNTGFIGFSNTARTHTMSEPFWKEGDSVPDLLRIRVTGSVNRYSDELSVYFNPERSQQYEPGFDARKLSGNPDAPQIYTKMHDTLLSVNALTFTASTCVVPLGFYVSTPGIYKLSATGTVSFPDNVTINLEDVKLNVIRDLRTTPEYSFTYDNTDNPDRFLLHFYNPAFGMNASQKQGSLRIYAYEDGIYIQPLNGKMLTGDVFVYDLTGREMLKINVNTDRMLTLKPLLNKGTYIVKVISGEDVYTQKVCLIGY